MTVDADKWRKYGVTAFYYIEIRDISYFLKWSAIIFLWNLRYLSVLARDRDVRCPSWYHSSNKEEQKQKKNVLAAWNGQNL